MATSPTLYSGLGVFDFPPFPRFFTIVLNKSYFDIFFAHFVKNLTPGHPSSGHQARSSDSISKKSLQSYHSHSGGEEDLKIAGFGIPSGNYILSISEFLYD